MPTRRGQPTGRANVTFSMTTADHQQLVKHAKRLGMSPGGYAKRLVDEQLAYANTLRKAQADQRRKDRQNAIN